MQIKITRYHLIPVRMAIIQKNTNNKCLKGEEKREPFVHCWWKFKLVQPVWKMVLRSLKKLSYHIIQQFHC